MFIGIHCSCPMVDNQRNIFRVRNHLIFQYEDEYEDEGDNNEKNEKKKDEDEVSELKVDDCDVFNCSAVRIGHSLISLYQRINAIRNRKSIQQLIN